MDANWFAAGFLMPANSFRGQFLQLQGVTIAPLEAVLFRRRRCRIDLLLLTCCDLLDIRIARKYDGYAILTHSQRRPILSLRDGPLAKKEEGGSIK
jgi:hypothetical protein